MRVREIMSSNAGAIGLRNSIAESAVKMRESNESCLAVVEGDEVVGIITERDLVFGCLLDGHISWKCQVGKHMVHQMISVSPDVMITEAVIILVENALDYLPVVEDGEVVGILSSRSFSRAIALEAYKYPAGTSLSA